MGSSGPFSLCCIQFLAKKTHKGRPFLSLLKPTVKNLATEQNIISLEDLKNIYQLVATNLEIVRKKQDAKTPVPKMKLKEGDLILLWDHTADVWDPGYIWDYRIVTLAGKTEVKSGQFNR